VTGELISVTTDVSQPGFSRIVPRVLVSSILRLNTCPKCSQCVCMPNAPPGPAHNASMGILPPPGCVDNQQIELIKVTNRETKANRAHMLGCWLSADESETRKVTNAWLTRLIARN